MYAQKLTKTQTIILLFILIAIGGVVLYGGRKSPSAKDEVTSPKMQGPSSPPPGYVAPR